MTIPESDQNGQSKASETQKPIKKYEIEEEIDWKSLPDEEVVARAYERLEKGRPEVATVGFRTLLDRDAKHPQGLLGMADTALATGSNDAAEIFARRAYEQDPENPKVVHALVKASARVGSVMVNNSQLDQGAEKLTFALDLLVQDRENQELLAMCFADLARALKPIDELKAVEAARVASALYPEEGRLRNMLEGLLESTSAPSKLVDYTMVIQEDERPELVLLTAQPNIGNMYLRSIMHALTGLPDRPMCYSYWGTEHDIHLPHLTVDLNRGGMGSHYTQATSANMRILKAFDVRYVIVTADLPMAIAAYDNAVANDLRVDPALLAVATLPDDQRLDLTLKLRAPWLLQFVSGWKKAVKDYDLNPFWFKAELLLGVDGQRPIIDAICRHFEMDEVTEEAKENIIAANQELFDKERQKLAKFYQHRLTADQQAWVDSLKPCFPEAF
jgi:hypothetical protein